MGLDTCTKPVSKKEICRRKISGVQASQPANQPHQPTSQPSRQATSQQARVPNATGPGNRTAHHWLDLRTPSPLDRATDTHTDVISRAARRVTRSIHTSFAISLHATCSVGYIHMLLSTSKALAGNIALTVQKCRREPVVRRQFQCRLR
jgi:hypothetical protein